jgi:AbrB family looped-hinge helix DNA binding protein
MVFFTWLVIKFCEAVAMKKTKISSKGQITLPISVRRKLNIATGDVLYVKESAEGSVVLEAEMQIKENRSSIADAITATTSRMAGKMLSQHRRQGLTPVDALIAASAISADAILVTGNVKHFSLVDNLLTLQPY